MCPCAFVWRKRFGGFVGSLDGSFALGSETRVVGGGVRVGVAEEEEEVAVVVMVANVEVGDVVCVHVRVRLCVRLCARVRVRGGVVTSTFSTLVLLYFKHQNGYPLEEMTLVRKNAR